MTVKIPSDIPSGDYLLRAEAIALHAASPGGGAQFYMSCYQITVSGGGSASPATVKFPGAYSASGKSPRSLFVSLTYAETMLIRDLSIDPGIGVSIHGNLNSYIVPGPAVYSGGTERTPGSGSCAGADTPPASTTRAVTTTLATTTSRAGGVTTTTTRAVTTTAASNPGGCSVQKYGQCGGNGYTGCTSCAVSFVSISVGDQANLCNSLVQLVSLFRLLTTLSVSKR